MQKITYIRVIALWQVMINELVDVTSNNLFMGEAPVDLFSYLTAEISADGSVNAVFGAAPG